MSKNSRGKKGEKKVSSLLRKLPGTYCVLDDVTLENETSKMTHQIDHICIHKHGLFVVETKNYFGTLEYDELEREWYRTIHGETTRIGSPLLQNKAHASALRKAIKGKYKPIPVVVFARDNAPYLGDENVINLRDVALFIDSYPYPREYTEAEMEEMKTLIENAKVSISHQEHVENIQIMKQVRKEMEAEMAYAIEQGRCPRCEGKIIAKDYSFRCSRCDFRFKL